MSGNGLENCKRCLGRGAVDIDPGPGGVPYTRRCECVLYQDILRNLDKGWRGLSKAPKIEKSVLLPHTQKDLRVICPEIAFKANLRHVGLRQGPDWDFRVVTDAQLMTAWLATAALMGKNLIDPEIAATTSLEALTLVDLIDPPKHLVIRLGVKTARNVAMPEVLLEALQHRHHVGKSTWVVEHPNQPLQAGHLCWSDDVMAFLHDHYKTVRITSEFQEPTASIASVLDEVEPIESVTKRSHGAPPSVALLGTSTGGTKAVDIQRQPSTKKGKITAWKESRDRS